METLKNILKNAIVGGDYISIGKVNKNAENIHAKIKWLAADCFMKGCSSGIIEYKKTRFYFYLLNNDLIVEIA